MKNWLLLTGNRWAVTALFLAVVLVALVLGGVAAGPGLDTLTAGDPVDSLFQALVTAIITGVTLVLTVNQLVLSQELGSLRDQRERLQGAMEYREEADDFAQGGASPAEPGAFLRHLLSSICDRAQALTEALEKSEDRDHGPVQQYATSVAERAQAVGERISGRRFRDFGMLWAALHYDYSRQIQDGRSLMVGVDVELGPETRDQVTEIVRGLILFGSVREHFKTLYFERDLIDLSRALLALALPSLVAAVVMLLYYDPTAFPGSVLGVPASVAVVSGGVVVSVAPFAVLLSFILRIATVTRRTLAAGPFILHPEEGRGESFGGSEA